MARFVLVRHLVYGCTDPGDLAKLRRRSVLIGLLLVANGLVLGNRGMAFFPVVVDSAIWSGRVGVSSGFEADCYWLAVLGAALVTD